MYRFRLEPLLSHRRHLEDVCKKELASCERQLSGERGKLRRLKEKKHHSTQELLAKQKININASLLILSVNYIRQLSKSIEEQAICVHKATRKVNQKRAELLEIMKNRKTLEKLKEKDQSAHQQIMLKNECKLMDEAAYVRYAGKASRPK